MRILKSLLLFPFLVASASAQVGIASHYPGDRGINYDPDVLFADDFESYSSASGLTSKWSAAYRGVNLEITPGGFNNSRSLQMSLPIGTTEIANALEKNLPGEDTVYFRIYQKWDAGYDNTGRLMGANHNGIRLSAKYPGPGSAPPKNGTGFFLFLVDNCQFGQAGETTPGYTHFYMYWPKQLGNFGDILYPTGFWRASETRSLVGNGTWNNDPTWHSIPNFVPQRDKWYCYELMVKANTPGQNDGEIAYWIDGKLASDFPHLNFRSIPTLKIDKAVVVLHSSHANRVTRKWYDNVVIAKKYIGPMIPLRP